MTDKQIKDLNPLVFLTTADKIAIQATPSDVTGYGTVQQIIDLVPIPPPSPTDPFVEYANDQSPLVLTDLVLSNRGGVTGYGTVQDIVDLVLPTDPFDDYPIDLAPILPTDQFFAHRVGNTGYGTIQDILDLVPAFRTHKLATRAQTDGSVGGPVGTEQGSNFLPSEWGNSLTFKFSATIWTNNAAKTMTARLVNVLTGQVVAALSTNATVPTKVISGALTVGAGATDLQTADTVYEVQIELTTGTALDLGKMSGAQIEIS